MDAVSIMSPGLVNPEYIARFATTPDIGLTSANSARKSFFASFMHSNSTLSI